MTANLPYHEGELLAFDLETTSPNPFEARIVTAAVTMQYGPGQTVASTDWVADAGVEIPEEAARIHGYTTARVREEGQPLEKVLIELVEILTEHMAREEAVVAYNASYDLTVISQEMARLGQPSFNDILGRGVGPVIDPFVIDKAADRYRKGSRKLAALTMHYLGRELEGAHGATADSEATMLIARALPVKFPALAVPPTVIHGWQVRWAQQQADSYQDYLRTQKGDTKTIIDGSWPLKTRRDAE